MAKGEHIAGIEAQQPMREWGRLEREQTVDDNLTAIHQSPNCVASGDKKNIKKKKNVAPAVNVAVLINIHPKKSFLFIQKCLNEHVYE